MCNRQLNIKSIEGRTEKTAGPRRLFLPNATHGIEMIELWISKEHASLASKKSVLIWHKIVDLRITCSGTLRLKDADIGMVMS